jgi:hypothetical protein
MSIYVIGELITTFVNYKPALDPGVPSDPDLNGEGVGLFNYYAGKYLISQKEQVGEQPTYLDGIIDNVRFYDRPINKHEVYELYSNKK